MRTAKNTSLPISGDLLNLSRYTTVAYVFASVILCCTIIFSYFTLKKVLVEQSQLHAFATTTNDLHITIRDSTLYLSDLKSAKVIQDSESQLQQKITNRLNKALDDISLLKNETSARLLALEGFHYYDDFHQMFFAPPGNIWLKLDLYVSRLKEIASDSQYGTPGVDLMWLPVEATAAKNGALGKSYQNALTELQRHIAERSRNLENTHRQLTLLSIFIVLFEILAIFLPLTRHLKKVNSKLSNAHKKLHLQANYDSQTGLPNTSGMAKDLQSEDKQNNYDLLIIISVINHETIAQIIGQDEIHAFFSMYADNIKSNFPVDTAVFRAGDNRFGVLLSSSDYLMDELSHVKLRSSLEDKHSLGLSIVYPEIRIGSV